MKNTGQFLKDKREQLGLTISEASLSTKISPKNLRAIEDGDLGQLPAQSFLKGFLRSYAQYLKLNPDNVLQMYLEETGTQKQTAPAVETEEKAPVIAGRSLPLLTDGSKAVRILSLVGIVVLIVLILTVKNLVEKYEKEAKVDPAVVTETVAEKTEKSEKDERPSETLIDGSAGEADKKSENKETEATKPAAAEAQSEAVAKDETKNAPAAPVGAPTAPVATPAVNPVEVKTAATKPPESKPDEVKSAEIKPVEIKQPVKPTETKPSEVKPAQAKPPEVKPTETKPAEVKAPEAKPVEAKPPEKVVEAKPAEIKPETKQEASMEIILEALDKVEIAVRMDKGDIKKIVLQPDEVHTIKGKGPVDLDLSDGGAVNVIVNGRDRGVPGDLGKPKKIKIP